jgi:hypothetical protein
VYIKRGLFRKNCWEVKKCGREPGGIHSHELGICPAATETRLDGVHFGTNGGRACWVVAGTMCRGEVRGNFAQNSETCLICDFHNKVRREEKSNYQFAIFLLNILRRRDHILLSSRKECNQGAE